jgi:hypothetical protein
LSKPDFPPLFAPGIHAISLSELEAVAVTPFPNDTQRAQLFFLFSQWIHSLQALQLRAILWVDGSFTTEKFGPGDIDCMMWSPSCGQQLTNDQQNAAERLTDRPTLKTQYGIDFFLEYPSVDEKFHREAYWKGVFGFQHDRKSAKGIVELSI